MRAHVVTVRTLCPIVDKGLHMRGEAREACTIAAEDHTDRDLISRAGGGDLGSHGVGFSLGAGLQSVDSMNLTRRIYNVKQLSDLFSRGAARPLDQGVFS